MPRWAGKALPTEAEWELAARGGLEGAEFCWGDEFAPRGKQMCNTWQGDFPSENLLTDGYEWTAPVGSFPPNGYGLHEMAGNVWEWTTDWFQSHGELVKSCCASVNPVGGPEEQSYHQGTRDLRIPRKVMKGGSTSAPRTTAGATGRRPGWPSRSTPRPAHLGFRCVVRVPKGESR